MVRAVLQNKSLASSERIREEKIALADKEESPTSMILVVMATSTCPLGQSSRTAARIS